MRLKCKACGYESWDYKDPDELARIITLLGGRMEMEYDENNEEDGWNIACPSGCESHYTELSYS